MSTTAAELLQVDSAAGLGLHEAGGKAQEAVDRAIVHGGQSKPKRIGRKRRSELSAKALAMEALYPDSHCLTADTTYGKSPAARARAKAEAARFAALPRCRCGVLLPCNDCLPTDAVTFQDERMFQPDSTLPEGGAGLNSVEMQRTPAYLKEKDAQSATSYARTGRPKKRKAFQAWRELPLSMKFTGYEEWPR